MKGAKVFLHQVGPVHVRLVVEHDQRRIFDLRDFGGDFRLALAVAGEAEVYHRAVQAAAQQVRISHAGPGRAAALGDRSAVDHDRAVVLPCGGRFHFRVGVDADEYLFHARIEREVDREVTHSAFAFEELGGIFLCSGRKAGHAEETLFAGRSGIEVETGAPGLGHVVHHVVGTHFDLQHDPAGVGAERDLSAGGVPCEIFDAPAQLAVRPDRQPPVDVILTVPAKAGQPQRFLRREQVLQTVGVGRFELHIRIEFECGFRREYSRAAEQRGETEQ